MNEKIKLICITCPRGCSLEVDHEGKTVTKVNGNVCKRGVDYARRELSDPRRMVASTLKINGGVHPLLPVCTSAPFPKPMIPDLLVLLREVTLQSPVKMGQVVLTNVLGTGIDMIASRDL
jgi:CxxC motif-containing protein